MKRLRVLSISTLFPTPQRPGFGKFVASQMLAVSARDDVDVTIINPLGLPPWPLSLAATYKATRSTPDYRELAGIRVYHPRFRVIPKIGGAGNPQRMARALLPLVRTLHSQTPFDLVDAQFFFPDGPAAAVIAQDLGLPYTIKARGSDIHYWGGKPAALHQMLDAARGAAGLLAVSAALKRDMVALGMPEDAIEVHYTGLDHGTFQVQDRQSARAQIANDSLFAIPATGPLLVTPGALIPIKGQHLAIEALKGIPEGHLALAGSGVGDAELRAQARELGLADRVHFLGQVPHQALPTLLSAADVMVLPSEREGLANAWVEALACGTPIVIPDVGGAREVVADPSCGRIVDRDPSAIADAVRYLIDHPPAREAVAQAAQRFSWDANAEQLAAFWLKAASAR